MSGAESVTHEARLVGTRLALIGAVLYLLEWAVIPFFPDIPTERLGDDARAIIAEYAGEARVTAFAVGWFALVLLGRVLYTVALRDALRVSGRPSSLASFAVGAMAVSVALEVANGGAVAGAAWLAERGADAASVVALDAAAHILFALVFAPIGVSVLAASLAMLASGLFRVWLSVLGVVSGSLLIVGGVLHPLVAGETGTFRDVGGLPVALGVPTFWLWMVVTSIILWRAVPARQSAAEASRRGAHAD
jgi:hypothetical protein